MQTDMKEKIRKNKNLCRKSEMKLHLTTSAERII